MRRFPLQVVGSWVWVWMGDADKADTAAIPPTIALDDPAYRLQAGQLDYDAHYLLIDDNLLDLSHLSFAHEKTLGMDMPQWADMRPRMSPIERGLRFERWHTGHRPRGFMKKLGETVDVWTAYDFLFPGIFLQRTVVLPGRHRGRERPQGAAARALVPSHRRAGGDAGRPRASRAISTPPAHAPRTSIRTSSSGSMP